MSLVERDEHAPWYVDQALFQKHVDVNLSDQFAIVPGEPKDLALVASLYQRCPVPGYDIKSVSLVLNQDLSSLFAGQVQLLEERFGNAAFSPHWQNDKVPQDEVNHRQKVMEMFHSISRPHQYTRAPHVHFLPCWRGYPKQVLGRVLTTGFANIGPDTGCAGKGLYTTPDAEYAYRLYNPATGALLINWVAVFSPFPVIAQDEELLFEKGNYDNYDTHFVPVYNPTHPHGPNYNACTSDQVPQYSELAVFEPAQMLPRYMVELQPSLPQ